MGEPNLADILRESWRLRGFVVDTSSYSQLKKEYARYDRLKKALEDYDNRESVIDRVRAKILDVAAAIRRAMVQIAKRITLRRR